MSWLAYPEYRDSGVEYLGPVPAHWTVSRFSRHIAINSGQVDPRIEPYRTMTLIGPNHIESGTGKLKALETSDEQGADSGKYLVRYGQLIYSKIRPNLAKAASAPTDCLCSADMYGLSPDPTVLDSAYALRILLSTPFTNYVIDSSMRVAMPKVNHESLGRAPLWFPPLGEQRAIVGFLDRETAKIDALIDKQEQLIATLREDRAATITHAVTKGLSPSPTLQETGTRWVDALPVHWTLSRLSRHISINSGQVDPRIEPYRDMILIAPNHVESGTGKLLETETAEAQGADSGKYRVSAGQVIYSKIRPNLAKATIAPIDCLCSADMYGLSTDPHELLPEFLLYAILSQPLTDYVIDSSMRVAMPKVNHESLGAAPLWIPPLEEQSAIVSFLNSRCASIDALIDTSTEMIEILREYRSALITNAVTGKIDVREAV